MVMYKHETRKKHNLYKRQKCTESTKRSQNAVAKIKTVERLPLWSNEILQEQKHIQFGPYKAKKIGIPLCFPFNVLWGRAM